MNDAWHYDLHACTPSPPQRWLLSAVLADDATALKAWRAWRDTQDIDDIDSASFRLLPLIYLWFPMGSPSIPWLAALWPKLILVVQNSPGTQRGKYDSPAPFRFRRINKPPIDVKHAAC